MTRIFVNQYHATNPKNCCNHPPNRNTIATRVKIVVNTKSLAQSYVNLDLSAKRAFTATKIELINREIKHDAKNKLKVITFPSEYTLKTKLNIAIVIAMWA